MVNTMIKSQISVIKHHVKLHKNALVQLHHIQIHLMDPSNPQNIFNDPQSKRQYTENEQKIFYHNTAVFHLLNNTFSVKDATFESIPFTVDDIIQERQL